jgi:hypothetical protein
MVHIFENRSSWPSSQAAWLWLPWSGNLRELIRHSSLRQWGDGKGNAFAAPFVAASQL